MIVQNSPTFMDPTEFLKAKSISNVNQYLVSFGEVNLLGCTQIFSQCPQLYLSFSNSSKHKTTGPMRESRIDQNIIVSEER